MSNLKHPVGLNRSTGSVFGKRKFYTAKAVVLNTSYGEVIIASSDDIVIQHASDCIMASDFKLDINEAQTIAIFDAKYVTSDDAHEKLTEQNKMLREALANVDDVLSGYSKPPSAVKLAIYKARKALEATKC